MALCSFIGDEVSAAGFRLAGVEVHLPSEEQTAEVFRLVRDQSQLILITAEAAGWLPEDLLARSLRAKHPLVLVIPDVRGRSKPAELAAALRHQLGMAR